MFETIAIKCEVFMIFEKSCYLLLRPTTCLSLHIANCGGAMLPCSVYHKRWGFNRELVINFLTLYS